MMTFNVPLLVHLQSQGSASGRPMTHDLMKNSLGVLGFRVSNCVF